MSIASPPSRAGTWRTESLALGVSMALKRADQGCVLTIAERFDIQSDVHVERTHMKHVLGSEQQPGNPRRQ